MEFQDVVRRRRMIRTYADRPVDRAVVDRMLSNAVRAPSAGFSQGWAFLVLDTPDDLARFLINRMKTWRVKLDAPDTLRLLIQKSSGVVGYALRPIYRAIDEPGRTLTREMVEAGDVDPLYS